MHGASLLVCNGGGKTWPDRLLGLRYASNSPRITIPATTTAMAR